MKYLSLLASAFLLLAVNQTGAATMPEPGLVGEYFDVGETLDELPRIPADKKPVVKRVDKTINFESTQEEFPGTRLVDFFYVRWTGLIRIPREGSYTFFLESDDGSRLIIDGRQVIDNGGRHRMTEKSGAVLLQPGDHSIKVEYFENEVDAGCKLSWQAAGGEKEIIPAKAFFHAPPPAETGLLGEYFALDGSLEDFPNIAPARKPVVKRVDKTINFESTQEEFHGTRLVDFFYVRWTGRLLIPKDGAYTFFLESDDGSRLFIDGKQIIDNGGIHGMEEKSARLNLTAGEHPIKVEFFENDVDAGCKLAWAAPGGLKEIVPAKVLSP